ncbi:hypothetical protein [Candidatus Laterigemmans baculatus]|uniref:hypothetical protein n=1 Tax=Candidatus Laterigemmans baculatus TaxID=2770505 RepID=UPI0013DAE91D|nr:hypothetical protein [Candidatus Laterigemmans baculatus]
MSPLKTFTCLLFVLALAGRLAAEDGPVEPYVAYVAREGEYARCGPSEEYYKTDPLRVGAEVEVYLETEDGWLGIRPPADSFCWLQSDQVEVAEDETLGTVIEPATVAWIGTHLGKARQYRWQVRLDEGEQVTIIGTARREGPDGDEVWYRIVPPPGEFRWVQRSQVCDTLDQVVYAPPNDPASEVATKPSRPTPRSSDAKARPSEATAQSAEAPPRTPAATPLAELAEGLASLLADAPVGSGLARMDDDVQIRSIASAEQPQSPGPSSAVQPAEWVAGSRVVPAAAVESSGSPLQPTAPPRLQPLPASPVQANSPVVAPSGYRLSAGLDAADLDSLRLELSHAMAAGALAAEVEPLRAHVERLSTDSSDAVLRGRASLLLRRVEEYQRVAQQRDGRGPGTTSSLGTAAPSIPSQTTLSQRGAAPSSLGTSPSSEAIASGGAAALPQQGTPFDGQGWLVRVYSARPDAPPYAITDSAGRTLSYITPSAGINLRRYLNQEVGLYGRVAYDTSLETPHLIAEQAVRLRTR